MHSLFLKTEGIDQAAVLSALGRDSQCSSNSCVQFNCPLELRCLICQVTHAFIVSKDWRHWPGSSSFSSGKRSI